MPEKQQKSEKLSQLPYRSKKKHRIGCSVLLIAKYTTLIVLPLLLLAAGTTGSVLVSRVGHESSTLAIASDVVECAEISLLYQVISILVVENRSNFRNDNPKGLRMDLFTLKEEDIIYHNYIDIHENYELSLPTTGPTKFIMPDNYYNRPWYMWSGSTIRIDFEVVYETRPTKADVYLIKGETRIKQFLSEETGIRLYEKKADMLSRDGNNSVTWKVEDNDYYYIAVDTISTSNTTFLGNFTFNFTYIDVEDYPWLKGTAQTTMGIDHFLTLNKSISSRNNNLTLCYIHPISSALESNSIHLNTFYRTDETMKLVFIATPFGLLTICIIILLGCFCLDSNIFRYKYRKGGYMLIN